MHDSPRCVAVGDNVDQVNHDEITRLYGPWCRRDPADVVELFDGYPGRWWIAGGWAIEAFTGVARGHGDIDPSIPRSDLPLIRTHLRGRLDVWAADRGTLRPLIDDDDPVPSTCSNLWLRPNGAEPWEYDVILMDSTEERWTYKRDARVSLPTILWNKNGVDYLRPEVQLLYKAPGMRRQDQQDFDHCLPMLSTHARQWLREALATAHPGHPWIAALS